MATAGPARAAEENRFIRRDGMRLLRGSEPYRITGANMWYAAWLGADAAYGDRARLGRELDRLQALGLNNLRIMAAAEEGPLRNSIKPGFSRPDGSLNQELLAGLDYAMAEIARRGMTAVVCLGNFWEWSGGIATWLYRVTGQYTDMNDPAHPWPAFPDATSAFYGNPQAVRLYHDYVRTVVTRTNSVTGVRYIDDPTVMCWQLANEPRPGGSEAVIAQRRDSYFQWIDDTAALIRSLDRNHLVSLGHEGTQGANGSEDIVRRAHKNIDYLTAHIWPLNWGWVNGKDLAGTWDAGSVKVGDYLATHERLANELGKPLLFEEFGFPRDGEVYSPGTPTTFRDRYYAMIYGAVSASWTKGGPIMGSNFWAWNGEARAAHPDYRFRDGDRAYMGDPPHEPQGWYGLFDNDESTLTLVRDHAAQRCLGLSSPCPAR
ncbi:glycoside hydrolase 5 family protein [Altererythrobacter sp. Root672]|uniref:glycoside hydrolase 5 family protein n=1 Tax=Altererythrobacter sp. Root672 TaxID=1736584 RepID=UPI0007004085|nr:cellulase family glycosylhydrolase [Altererythrobacter sp. Root672]KRA80833.1 mannanase [Altererythrobacter sp. Root672]